MRDDFKVAVCIVTYNQENYIGQAIESVLNQHTDFEVTIFVGNDSSTDTTMQVVEDYANKYPNKIRLLCTERNLGIVGNTYNVFRCIFDDESYRYVAMLDGDDWWSDENKLQKQVDFMEINQDYAFVFSRIAIYNQNTNKIRHTKPKEIQGGNLFPILMRIAIPNCTVLHRRKFLENIDWESILNLNLLSCDYVTNVWMANQGKVGYIDDETAVWRRGGGTVSSPLSREKALNYIDHEIRQSLWLAKVFSNTPYSYFTVDKGEKHRNNSIWQLAISRKDYALLKIVDFDVLDKPKPLYAYNSLFFIVYVYVIKKIKTAIKLLGSKL